MSITVVSSLDNPTATPGDYEPGPWIGFSLKTILFILVGVVVFIWYVRVLLYGENSLSVLTRLTQENASLQQQVHDLKISNQNLQKQYFELLQLNSD